MIRIIFLILLAVYLFFYFTAKPPEIKQPLQFNHKAHADLLIGCSSCHMNSESEREAGIPNIENCALCHNSENKPLWIKTASDLKRYVAEKRQIQWERVYRVKGHALFSHKRHTAIARIDCKDCHGDLTKMTESVKRVFIDFSAQRGMNNCVDCHRRERVATDCLMCHR